MSHKRGASFPILIPIPKNVFRFSSENACIVFDSDSDSDSKNAFRFSPENACIVFDSDSDSDSKKTRSGFHRKTHASFSILILIPKNVFRFSSENACIVSDSDSDSDSEKRVPVFAGKRMYRF